MSLASDASIGPAGCADSSDSNRSSTSIENTTSSTIFLKINGASGQQEQQQQQQQHVSRPRLQLQQPDTRPSSNGHARGKGSTRGGGGAGGKKGVDERGGGGGGGASRTKALLSDIAKISLSGDDAPEDALERFLTSVASIQALDIFKASPPSTFVGELLTHLVRLLPGALASPAGAATFIECLQPLEGLDNFVLPASFYRAVASAEEPPTPPPRGHTWKRRKEEARIDAGVAPPIGQGAATVTGLETLREYLCMNGRDCIDCDRRTVVTTLTRALLGSWEASVAMGRELFDQSVLKSPNRADPVGLGLEILLQCLVQEDEAFCAMEEKVTDGEEASPRSSDHRDRNGNRNDNGDRRNRPRPTTKNGVGPDPPSATDETRACVAIVGNYVRADADTAGAFFRDIIPKVMIMGSEGGGRGRAASSGRVPRRLAAVLRSLVDSTRTRNSFNVERMVVHTVKEVKDWTDAVLSSKPSDTVIAVTVDDGISDDGEAGAGIKMGVRKRKSNDGDKLRRRGLVLACLDVLGPTASCMSLIREEMVDGESKASLRSAVADAILEYRRTSYAAGAEHAQACLLGVLSSLAEDGFVNVRLSAVAAVAEVCSSNCVPAVSLLLKRCLDTSPKARRLAVRLLVDEFSVGTSAGGAKLARTLLLPTSSSRGGLNAPRASGVSSRQGGREGRGPLGATGGGGGSGGGGVVSVQEGESGIALLGRLLKHQKALEETDKERFPILLKGLVEALLRGDNFFPRSSPPAPTAAAAAAAAAAVVGDSNSSSSSNGDDGDARMDGGCSNNTDFDSGNGGGGGGGGASGIDTPAIDRLLDASSSHGNDVGVVSWKELAAPAARVWTVCRPCDPNQLGVLDAVLGDIFRVRP